MHGQQNIKKKKTTCLPAVMAQHTRINQSAINHQILIQLQELYIKENIQNSAKESLGFYELKQHKTWFHEEYSQFLDQREQAKL